MAPKPKLNGINVPTPVLDEALKIVAVEGEAFLAMGGVTKKTVMSDVVTFALTDFIKKWRKLHGLQAGEEIPTDANARRAFTKAVGLKNLELMRQKLLEPEADED
jgi:hypothetical protein